MVEVACQFLIRPVSLSDKLLEDCSRLGAAHRHVDLLSPKNMLNLESGRTSWGLVGLPLMMSYSGPLVVLGWSGCWP